MQHDNKKEPTATWWLAALFVAAHALPGLVFYIPYFYPTEAWNIINVRSLVGIGGNLINPVKIGFSLLLTPALLFDHPLAPYYLAIILNSIGLGALFGVLVRIARSHGARHPLLCASAASCFPALWVYANHAEPDITLTLIVTVMYLMMDRYQERARPLPLVLVVLLAAFAGLISMRMVLPAAAAAALPMVLLLARHRSNRAALIAALGAGAIAACFYGANFIIGTAGALHGSRLEHYYWIHASPPQQPLQELFSLVCALTGPLLYLGLATCSLTLLVLYATAARLKGQIRDRVLDYRDLFLCIIVLAVLVINGAQQGTMQYRLHTVLGRNLDIFMPLLLVLGICFVEHQSYADPAARKQAWRRFGVLCFSLALFFALALVKSFALPDALPYRQFFTGAGLGGYQLLFGGFNLPLYFAAALALTFAAFLWQLKSSSSSRWMAAPTLLLLLLLESITIICHIYLGDIRNRLPAIADFKRIMADEKFAGISCLDFVASTGIPWFASDFAVRYPGKVMHYVDLKSDKVDLCSDYVLSPTNDQIKRRFPATCISDMVKFEPPYYLYNVKGHNCHS